MTQTLVKTFPIWQYQGRSIYPILISENNTHVRNLYIYWCGTYTLEQNSNVVVLVLTIFNKAAYLTFKSIFNKKNNFSTIVKSSLELIPGTNQY